MSILLSFWDAQRRQHRIYWEKLVLSPFLNLYESTLVNARRFAAAGQTWAALISSSFSRSPHHVAPSICLCCSQGCCPSGSSGFTPFLLGSHSSRCCRCRAPNWSSDHREYTSNLPWDQVIVIFTCYMFSATQHRPRAVSRLSSLPVSFSVSRSTPESTHETAGY